MEMSPAVSYSPRKTCAPSDRSPFAALRQGGSHMASSSLFRPFLYDSEHVCVCVWPSETPICRTPHTPASPGPQAKGTGWAPTNIFFTRGRTLVQNYIKRKENLPVEWCNCMFCWRKNAGTQNICCFFCFFSPQRLSLFTIYAPQQLQWRLKCGVFLLFKKKKKATEGGSRAATACAPVPLVQFTSHKGPENIVLYVVLSFLGSYFWGCCPAPPPPPFPSSPPPNITPQTFNPCHSKPLSPAPNSCSLMLFDACWNLLILLK